LTPIPIGRPLKELSQQLLAQLDEEAGRKVDAAGKSVLERFKEELERMGPLPLTPFQVAKVLPVSVRSTSTVRVEGAWYSVPSHWARLDATAYLGVEEVRIVCPGEAVTHPRERAGGRRIRYQHYLSELARKPQAVRQVAPGSWWQSWESPTVGCGSFWWRPTAPRTALGCWPESSAP
jgi:hypothetical protein